MITKPIDHQLTEALERSLESLAGGKSLDSCLQEYPDLVDELRPLLETALRAGQLRIEYIPPGALQRSRTQALGRAAELRGSKPAFGFLARIPRLAANGLVALVLISLSLFSMTAISASALPGDSLYPIKRTLEETWLLVAVAPGIRQGLENTQQARRIEEIHQLLALARKENVQFEGVLIRQEPWADDGSATWVIGDLDVILTSETDLVGTFEIGMVVSVQGQTMPGQGVIAEVIQPVESIFVGVLESISGEFWQVDGQRIQITSQTEIDPEIVIGDSVLAVVEFDEVGTMIALGVFASPGEEPSSTATQKPSEDSLDSTTPIGSLTPTPSPTETPAPLETLQPTATSLGLDDGTPAVEISPTYEATEEDEVETPEATDKPDASETPRPSRTDEPTETDEPDDTDEPTDTDEPSKTPEPTDDD